MSAALSLEEGQAINVIIQTELVWVLKLILTENKVWKAFGPIRADVFLGFLTAKFCTRHLVLCLYGIVLRIGHGNPQSMWRGNNFGEPYMGGNHEWLWVVS